MPGLGLLGAVLVPALAACEEDRGPVTKPSGGKIAYGTDASQFGELYLPEGTPRGVVVVIHGGFWKSEYDLTLGAPLATSLAKEGWAAWNLEYRRVGGAPGAGGGGGDPETFDDIAAGIDKLADLDLDLATVVTLGHSAGGHLATWAASRGRDDRWAGGVDVTAVISQAGVLDLRTAYDDGLGAGAVEAFLGHAPGPADAILDPQQQIPLDVPVWCVHGTDDPIVPISQSQDYVAAATDAGAKAEMVEVEGDHFVVIDATSPAWTKTLAVLDQLG
ncbi:alpha/beta hydrolase [Nocardioides sp. KIGAM211]|uniref:Alpha/beta hydrolase n=1 Tax=Nocardioides luti TaxID=2761101 RepID=A0A7X0VBX3_9ACTN|nr:alpha/beta hydrolase [Nocardioides luti]MBB6628407.1 alpha/beta hydrolase [Nocardioides luti]